MHSIHQNLKHNLRQGRKIQSNNEESTFSIVSFIYCITATRSQETWIFGTEAMNITQLAHDQ